MIELCVFAADGGGPGGSMELIQDLFRTLYDVPEPIRIGRMTGLILFHSLLPGIFAFGRVRLRARDTAALPS
jgi:hypothetical protein